jgi:MinD-like ATPase involved in chromosome partitioning or flagellar assembly
MLRVALLTPNSMAAEGIEQLMHESGLFKLTSKTSTTPAASVILRSLAVQEPEIILLDIGDRESAARLAQQIQDSNLDAIVIGFGSGYTASEQSAFAELGILDLIPEVFSAAELESAAYEALHRKRPVSHGNILAFLPAKAGGGCSTVCLNTAAALTGEAKQRTLLVEADRRSGVLSILLSLHPHPGLAEALAHAAEMTAGEWHQYYRSAFGMHLLLADPGQPGPLHSWGDYYQLLHFVQRQYDFVFIDLPEIVNQASAELVRSARGVFVVCTPEVPSLKMAAYRCAELEACEIPPANIHIVVNRWESGRLSIRDIEGIVERPAFGTLPNDYSHVTDAIVDSRLVAVDSEFGESCRQLARKLSGLPEAPKARSKFDLLKKLGRLSG